MSDLNPKLQPVEPGEAPLNSIDARKRESMKKLGRFALYTAPVTMALLGKKAEAKDHDRRHDHHGSSPRVPSPSTY